MWYYIDSKVRSKLDRQAYILQVIRTNPDIIIDDLVRMTGACRGTVIHDVHLLRQQNPGLRKLKRRKRNLVR